MARRSILKNIVVSAIALATAGVLGAQFLGRPLSGSTGFPTAFSPSQVQAILPNADPLLVSRVAGTWGYTSLDVAKQYGEDGLQVLDTFGDDADFFLKKKPEAFASLTRLWRLDPERFRVANGPWNRAVLDWAEEGKLDAFLKKLNELPRAPLAVAERSPAALPLLIGDETPEANAMLDQYGDRAWRLFMGINFIDSPPSVERVAGAISHYGDLPLDLNERFGLPAALMLVAPPTEKGSRNLPDVVQHACKVLDPALAVTLMLVNYDDVAQLLDSGTDAETLYQALDLLAAQPDFVQMLAVEDGHILRLLTETWQRQKVGAEAFRRCGPAATISYTYYGSDRRLSQAAVISMGRIGWPAFDVLDRYREYGPFFDLLKRPELLNADAIDPLVIDAIGNISRYPQDKIDVYLNTKNLAGELMQDRYPAPDSEKYLQWVPLYMAYRVSEKYAKGLHVSSGDVAWAGVDVILTLTPLKGTGEVANGAEALAGAAERGAAETAVEQGLSQGGGTIIREGLTADGKQFLAAGESQLLSHAERTAIEALGQEGVELSRFGPDAGKIAIKRLEARGDGIALGLADRSAEYGAARSAGDLGAKNLIAEEIGLEGAERYAEETGCKPLFVGKARQGAGFDLVFRDGNRIKVIEAKGGGSQIKHFHGYWQGTPEYTREVAKNVLARSSASAEEKDAAQTVLKAMDEGRLDIEVVRTDHVQGKPRPTRVESSISVGSNAEHLSASQIKSLIVQTPGALTAFVRTDGEESASLAMESFIYRSQGMAKRAGVELWTPGAGPLMPRVIRRRGEEITIQTLALPAGVDGVGDFAIAIMERRLQ